MTWANENAFLLASALMDAQQRTGQRLGQIIVNACAPQFPDSFYVDDIALIERVKSYGLGTAPSEHS